MELIFQAVIAITIELVGLFFLAKYHKKLPSPLHIAGKRLESYVNGIMNRYIASVLENFEKDPQSPQIIAGILKKPMELLLDDMMEHPPKSLARLQGGANALEQTGDLLVDAGQIILPMFGKKGQMAAQGLRLLPLLKGKKQSNDSGKHPFDR